MTDFYMPSNKSLGPDGFSPKLYKYSWNIIKDEFISNIQKKFTEGYLPKDWNQTYIVLIPKVEVPTKLSNYRPISLCNFCYNVITKIMAKNLKNVLPRIIPHSQFAFVNDRYIHDNILLAQEILHNLWNAKPQGALMAIKIDLTKAYDKFRRELIIKVMQKLRFCQKRCQLVWECIASPSFSVIVNGTPAP